MNAVSLLPVEAEGHVETALPWYVNGTLPEAERVQVERHLSECAQCRASQQLEVLLQKQLRIPEVATEQSERAGWEELSSRLDSLPAVPGRADTIVRGAARGNRPARRRLRRRVTSLVLFAQAGAIAALAVALLSVLHERNAPAYRTLTDVSARTDSSVPALRVVFSDDVTSATMRTLLADIGGTISDGPGVNNVYTVRLSGAPLIATHRVDETADWLRAQSGVLFAEVVNPPESR